ncbi:hypothetical protein LZL87_010860 [Fusarium oxysporum]|nr:hypothetical protein LZL87_010860 [Fusarium oxysporum]
MRKITDTSKKRDDDVVEMRVDQQNFLYWANFTIGNPPQRLSAEIDTGNSDLLVLTNEIETCKEKGCLGGIFNPEKSNTFEWSDEQVSGAFRIGESWEGVYANDTFTLGSSTLDSFQFIGVTEFNATSAGILSIFGVGIYTLEHAEIKYPNLPYALADAGEINTPAFSLWLNNQTHGKFLFGGVKKAKYTGPLVTYPVAVDNENDLRDNLEFEPRPVLLDSGTIQSRLTLNMTLHLIKTMKVSMDEKLGAVAPCNTSSKETLDFTFGDLGFERTTRKIPRQSPNATDIILGDDFLRCAYVYDWANMEISLAQYHSEEAEDEILEIMRDVPGASTAATGVPRRYLKYDQPAESAGTAISRELPTVTVTPLSTATGSVTGSAAPSSTAAEAGVDEDNGAVGNVPANMVYMMLVVFISNVVTLA